MLKQLFKKSSSPKAHALQQNSLENSAPLPVNLHLAAFVSSDVSSSPEAPQTVEGPDYNQRSNSLTSSNLRSFSKAHIKGWEGVTLFSAASWEQPFEAPLELATEDEEWKPGNTEKIIVSKPSFSSLEDHLPDPSPEISGFNTSLGASALEIPEFDLAKHNEAITLASPPPHHLEESQPSANTTAIPFNPPTPDVLETPKAPSSGTESIFNPLNAIFQVESDVEELMCFTLPTQLMQTEALDLFPPDSTPENIANATLNTQKASGKKKQPKIVVEAFEYDDPASPSLEELLRFGYPLEKAASAEMVDIATPETKSVPSKPSANELFSLEEFELSLEPFKSSSSPLSKTESPEKSLATLTPSLLDLSEELVASAGAVSDLTFFIENINVDKVLADFGTPELAPTEESVKPLSVQNVQQSAPIEMPIPFKKLDLLPSEPSSLTVLPAEGIPITAEASLEKLTLDPASDPNDYSEQDLQELASSIMHPVEPVLKGTELPVPSLITMREFKEEQGLIALKSPVTIPVLPPPSEEYADLRTILINMGLERLLPEL